MVGADQPGAERPAWRWRRGGCLLLATALLALVAVGVAVPAGLVWLQRHPDVLARGICRAAGWPEDAVVIGAIEVDRSLRLRLTGLEVHPPAANAPDVYIADASCDLPRVAPLLEREIALGDVTLGGLRVEARGQQPAPPLKEALAPIVLSADRVVLAEASFTAPEDPPMGAVAAGPIAAELHDVRWTPARRRISATGQARTSHLQLGGIELRDLVLPQVILRGTSAEFPAATFVFAETGGSASGRITDLDGNPATEIRVVLVNDPVERAIESAIGHRSPIRGRLTADLVLRAGGDLPRGASSFDGWLRLTNAAFFVGDDLRAIPKILLDLAPWFRRSDGGWLQIGDLVGQAQFGRGWVELNRLERPSDKHRVLQAWGHLRDGRIELLVRAIPKKHMEERVGIGISVDGPLGRPRLRLARKEELAGAPPPLDH